MTSPLQESLRIALRPQLEPALPLNELNEIVAQLAAVGLDLRAGEIGMGCAATILVADQWSATLQEELIRLSARIDGRVVLIIGGRSPWPEAQLWEALHSGAADVIDWKTTRDPAAKIYRQIQRWYEIDELVNSPVVRDHLVGGSRCWTALLRNVVEVARFSDLPVLVLGESGTGKELAARLIHTLDSRHDKSELVLVDCTTISPHLSGSEFFGHERGAFTGAHAARDGAFALANKGSLFLDEVGELPLPLQAELLRVIQERTYKRVGGNQWQRTEFRLICATNRDLRAEVSRGRFRADLYYRLATWTFTLPPLRQRREDILPLAEHFIGAACPDDTPQLSGAVKKYLANREFRGNVRELRLLMARILSRHTGPGQISIGAIPQDDRPVCDAADEQKSAHSYHGLLSNAIQLALQMGSSLKEIGREAEAIAVQQVLQEEGGNLPRAAQRLQVTARALQIREARKRQDGNGRYDAVGEEEI